MPPKKPAKKLHELAPEVKAGFKIDDISKRTYIVGKQFATGGFGRIHTCTEQGKSQEMVMKIEPSTNGPLLTEVVVFNRILKKEMIETYKKDKKIQWIGLPHLIANGYFTYNSEKMRYMIIPKYAMSLEGAREANGGKLSAKDSMVVANCIIGALEYLHDSDYAHADVKAANILLEKQGVYSTSVLVDFGLAHRTTNNVDKPDKKRAHNGTCIFTSTDAHRGNNPSFRGDVEILAYNLIMWISGTLPWLALESSPDKVFEAKQKFVAGLPGTLQNVLTSQPAAVTGCISTMFDVSMKTQYKDKVDMEKLKKVVAGAIQSASGAVSKESKTTAKTPKKVTRKAKEEVEDDVDDEPKPKKKVETKSEKTKKTVRPKTPKRIETEEDEEDEMELPTSSTNGKYKDESDEEEELIPRSTTRSARAAARSQPRPQPSIRLGVTTSTASSSRAARKIEQKYKRLSTNKSSLVPVSIADSNDDDDDAPPAVSTEPSTSSAGGTKRSSGGGGEIALKTPALVAPAIKKAKYKSGISSATKASPTELRRVPGVRNFPKGRRTMLIKETTTKYQEKRAATQTNHDDSSSSDL
ncbi:unnamed protein product [Caenorhabditis brenneri]